MKEVFILLRVRFARVPQHVALIEEQHELKFSLSGGKSWVASGGALTLNELDIGQHLSHILTQRVARMAQRIPLRLGFSLLVDCVSRYPYKSSHFLDLVTGRDLQNNIGYHFGFLG